MVATSNIILSNIVVAQINGSSLFSNYLLIICKTTGDNKNRIQSFPWSLPWIWGNLRKYWGKLFILWAIYILRKNDWEKLAKIGNFLNYAIYLTTSKWTTSVKWIMPTSRAMVQVSMPYHRSERAHKSNTHSCLSDFGPEGGRNWGECRCNCLYLKGHKLKLREIRKLFF